MSPGQPICALPRVFHLAPPDPPGYPTAAGVNMSRVSPQGAAMIHQHVRGHPVAWVYADTREPVGDWDRPCARCGRPPLPAEGQVGYDACLGHIPGAIAACCGHGAAGPYVLFEDGVEIRGEVGDRIVRCGVCSGAGCGECDGRGVVLVHGTTAPATIDLYGPPRYVRSTSDGRGL